VTSASIARASASGAVVISAGGDQSCALLSNGTVECWGSVRIPYSPDGGMITTLTASTVPVAVPNVTDATALAVGGYHTCVLRANGLVSCWGVGDSGQLANGTVTPCPPCGVMTPVDVPSLWHRLASHRDWFTPACATLTAGCPVGGPISGQATAISVGISTSCAILADVTAMCWGNWGRHCTGAPGELWGYSYTPVAVPNVTGVTSLAVGGSHICALLSNGAVVCWGDNDQGQLGAGFTNCSMGPVQVKL
jgi:alpha-tubulin suppressor-like RCC1 family protein